MICRRESDSCQDRKRQCSDLVATSGSGYSVTWGPCHLITSLGNTATQVASRPCSKLITQVLCSSHLSFSPSPMSYPLLQHLLLLRLLKIDAGFLLQSREPVLASTTVSGIHLGNRGCHLVLGCFMSW